MKLKKRIAGLVLTLLCTHSLLAQFSAEEQAQIDSLKTAFKNAKHDTTRCNLLVNIAEYLYSSKPDTVIALSEETIQLVNQHLATSNSKERYAFLRSKASALNNIGIIHADNGDLNAAITYYLKSLEVHQENHSKIGISEAFNNLGIIYDNLGDTPNALEYFHKALKIQEELKLKSQTALTLNNIGFIYANQNDAIKALEYYKKSLKYRVEVDDKAWIPQSLNNIASVYEKFGDPNCRKDKTVCLNEGKILALNYYKECLDLQTKSNDRKGLAYSLNNIASIYRKYGDPNTLGSPHERKINGEKLAIEFLNQSLKIHEEIKNNIGIAYVSNNLAQVLINQGNLTQALVFSNRSMKIAKDLGFPEVIYRNAMTLKKIYKLQNKPNDAFAMFELEILMRDSINNLSNQKALITQNTKYEYEKKATADSVKVVEEKKVTAAQLKQEKTQRFALYGTILLVGLFAAFMFNRFKITKKQNGTIHKQKNLIEEKHKEITDSINYAERIQRSFLATKELLDENLSEYFVFFKPKDIVSGDFYWASKLNNGNFALVTADSTGHGVPGSIMSLLNSMSLEKAIETHTEPSEILNASRHIIIDRLKKDGTAEGGKDGMDASITVYDFAHNKLIVAAANNPVWIIRSVSSSLSVRAESRNENRYELLEIKPDKMPVGKHDKQDVSFTQQEITLQQGDLIYTLTDGFPDQFGGEHSKKFMSKHLKELLLANAHLPMAQQKNVLDTTFANWRGTLEQVDDVCVIGVKI